MRTAHQGYRQNKMDDEHLMLLSKKQKTTPSYQPDILGEVKKSSKGQIFYRGTVYQNIIRESQPSELQAYALYRAIQCYAPAGTNECGDEVVSKAIRKQWFQKLKTQYPNTTWAKSLKYYW